VSFSEKEARHAARLAAIQALYQMELAGMGADEVAQEFIEHRFGGEIPPDAEFFAGLVRGVPGRQGEIDTAIAGCLTAGWTLARVDSILRAILRAGCYELVAVPAVPARAVIDEYVVLAHEFFGGDEPGFVNAALDRLARGARPTEFGQSD
jgi:transcription antitermination protein NusB